MKFNSLKDKCEYFRSLTDYKLVPNSYVIAMLDGRAFSNLVKKKFTLPFDDKFIGYMDTVAKYLCENVQGAKFAYVQSDEISLLITDFDTPDTDAPFGYRICKLQSLLASMATGKFNQLVAVDLLKEHQYEYENYPFCDAWDEVAKMKLAEFDCKVWSVPDYNTAFCHFLWRQNDCTRNSKQQAAQTFLSHKQLNKKSADEQIELLAEEKGIVWCKDYDDGKKYGRLIYKEEQTYLVSKPDGNGYETGTYTRDKWEIHFAGPFAAEGSVIKTLIPRKHE